MELFNTDESKLLQQHVTLINYESVWRKSNESKYKKVWDCIICDEAHNLKNRTSKQSSFLLRLSVTAKYRYILTGTPISNGKLEDIWSQLCFLDPYIERGRVYSNIFKNYTNSKGSYYDFTDRFCILNQFYQPYKYLRISELQMIINAHSYKVYKKDCLDLPDKLPDEIVKVDLLEPSNYKKLAKNSALVEYDILAENSLSKMIKLRELASGFIQDNDKLYTFKCSKNTILKEIIESYDDTKKLVIFAEFKYSIQSIKTLLNDLKIKHVVLDGEQKNKKIWRDFQNDESIRVIVCQYKSANAGIDLYASDTIIYYEPTIKSDWLEQSRDRIHRKGQSNACSYIHLITKGTIEMDIYRALSNYQDFTDKLFTEYMNTFQKGYK